MLDGRERGMAMRTVAAAVPLAKEKALLQVFDGMFRAGMAANGRIQRLLHRGKEVRGTVAIEAGRLGCGIQPGLEENFICVDIAYARHQRLIHQNCFDIAFALGKDLREGGTVESGIERIGAEFCLRDESLNALAKEDAADPPRIHIGEPLPPAN